MISLLLLPEQPAVSWARLTREGEGGTFSYTIDASGLDLRNRMMHRELIPAPSDARIQVRVRYKSTLVATDNGFEGFAVRIRGFQLEGSAPTKKDRQIFEYNPEAQGKKAWIAAQETEWTTRNFIIDLEEHSDGNGVDYYTVELVVRATSGQLILTNVECQTLYSKEMAFTTISATQTFSQTGLYTVDISTVNAAGETDIRRYMRDLQSIDRTIPKGKRLMVTGKALMRGLLVNGNGGNFDSRTIYVFLKMRIKGTGQYDYYQIGTQGDGVYPNSYLLNLILDTEAENDYEQTILSIGAAHLEGNVPDDAVAITDLSVFSLQGKLFINDFIAPSQG